MAAVDRTQVCVVRGSGELLLRERPAGRAAERLARGHDDEGLAVERGQCLRLLERPPARRHFVTGGTCGSPDGTFAEYARAAEDRLSPKPATLTFEQAALPVSGMTALQAVRDHGGVTPGQHVLSLGNSGGVGSSAVQIAETHGATVTGVASRGEADFVRSLGANTVLDHTSGRPADRRDDVILDLRQQHARVPAAQGAH